MANGLHNYLFASKDGEGFTEVLWQIDGLTSDYDAFWEALQIAFGIDRVRLLPTHKTTKRKEPALFPFCYSNSW